MELINEARILVKKLRGNKPLPDTPHDCYVKDKFVEAASLLDRLAEELEVYKNTLEIAAYDFDCDFRKCIIDRDNEVDCGTCYIRLQEEWITKAKRRLSERNPKC